MYENLKVWTWNWEKEVQSYYIFKNASYCLEPTPIVPCPRPPKRANTKHLNGNGLKSPDKAMC